VAWLDLGGGAHSDGTVLHTVATSWPLPETVQSCAGSFEPLYRRRRSATDHPILASQKPHHLLRAGLGRQNPFVAFASPPACPPAPSTGTTPPLATLVLSTGRLPNLFPPARPPILDLHPRPNLLALHPRTSNLEPRPSTLDARPSDVLFLHGYVLLLALTFDILHFAPFVAAEACPSEHCSQSPPRHLRCTARRRCRCRPA
jgi:hypothetical protein